MAPLQLAHPRDLAAWRRDGVRFSTCSDEAAKLFDLLMYQMFAITDDKDHGGMEGTFELLVQADPDFVLTRVLRFIDTFHCQNWRERKLLIEETAAFAKKAVASPNITDLERRHVLAVEKFVSGLHREAIDLWQDLLNLYPKDLLAVRQIFDYGITAGDAGRMRAAMVTVQPHYELRDPYFAFMLSRLAFTLEEHGDFGTARKMTQRALEVEPKDAWAAHTMAHILDGIGAGRETVQFMEGSVREWSQASHLACHNFWHTALGHMELGDFDAALAIYDADILPRVLKSASLFPLSDAASLLFRLQMEGRSVPAEQWRTLASVGMQNRMSERRLIGYYDAMATLCFAHVASDTEAAPELSSLFRQINDDIEEYSSASEDLSIMHHEIGRPVISAAQKYLSGDYSGAASLLYPRRFDLSRMGGSNAQRDVFSQMLCRALLNSDRQLDWGRCRALLEERQLAKGPGGVTQRLWSGLAHRVDSA